MEGIQAEAEKVFKKQKTLQHDTIQNIDKIIANLKSSTPASKVTVDLAQKIQDQYKDMQLCIHKYSKTVEKRWKQELDLDWTKGAFNGKVNALIN